MMYTKEDLMAKSVAQLKEMAKELGLKVKSNVTKENLAYDILDQQAIEQSMQRRIKRQSQRFYIRKMLRHLQCLLQNLKSRNRRNSSRERRGRKD